MQCTLESSCAELEDDTKQQQVSSALFPKLKASQMLCVKLW